VGNAVVRNRAKRLLREAFRATRDLWAADLDLVVIVKRVTPGMGLAQVVTEWRRAERAIRRRTVEARKDREMRSTRLARDA
jgi:RNase P protein component